MTEYGEDPAGTRGWRLSGLRLVVYRRTVYAANIGVASLESSPYASLLYLTIDDYNRTAPIRGTLIKDASIQQVTAFLGEQ